MQKHGPAGTRPGIASITLIAAAVVILFAGLGAQRGAVTSIVGMITDEDGAPLPGVTVVVDGQDMGRRSYTAVDGTFAMRGLRSGEYELAATLTGFCAHRRAVTLPRGKTTRVDFAMALAGPVDDSRVEVPPEAAYRLADAIVRVQISRRYETVPWIGNRDCGTAGTEHEGIVVGTEKSDPEHGPAAPRLRFLQVPAGWWSRGMLDSHEIVPYELGAELLVFLRWNDRFERFVPLGERYVLPVLAGAVSWRWRLGDDNVQLASVEEFLTGLRNLQGARPVSFPTADGGIVHADVYGEGDSGVVLAHGGRFTKESWAEQAPVLAAAGFRVVAIDFRGRGQSRGGSQEGAEDDVHLDVIAAVRWLHAHGARSVSVVGASFGGWAAARASMELEDGEIDRLVLLAHSPVDEPERIKGAKLFIVARDDPYFGGEKRLVDIRDQYERAVGTKQLVVLDGDAHAQFIFDTDQGERLMQEILRFLSRATG